MTTKITMLLYMIFYPCSYPKVSRKYLSQVFRGFSGLCHIVSEGCKLLAMAVVGSSV